MLTGDKIETAICIAISTGMKSPEQELHIIKEFESPSDLENELAKYSEKCSNSVLIIDGISLATALTKKKEYFFNIASNAPAVVCCRCSPTQKAEVTKGVKEFYQRVVASIGKFFIIYIFWIIFLIFSLCIIIN